MVVLGIVLIVILSAVEAVCLVIITIRTRDYLKERSEQRTAARRAATRPPAYKKVRESWAIYRNRRSLWNSIQK